MGLFETLVRSVLWALVLHMAFVWYVLGSRVVAHTTRGPMGKPLESTLDLQVRVFWLHAFVPGSFFAKAKVRSALHAWRSILSLGPGVGSHPLPCSSEAQGR